MTDNEIIKAQTLIKKLEEAYNAYYDTSKGMPYDIDKTLRETAICLENSLAEINRQKADIENQSQNFKVLVSDHRTLQQSFDNLKCLYESEKAKVEKAKEKSIHFAKELQTAKEEVERLSDRNHKCIYLSDDETTEYCVDGPCPKFKTESKIKTEAIKEFAERVKADVYDWIDDIGVNPRYAIATARIDNLVKEMVGDTE